MGQDHRCGRATAVDVYRGEDNTNGDTRWLYGALLDWGASRGLRDKVEKDIRGTANEVAHTNQDASRDEIRNTDSLCKIRGNNQNDWT